MALFDLVCPNCKSGLVVDTSAGATATVGEALKLVTYSSPEQMAAAEATIANAREKAAAGQMAHAQALAEIEGAQTASRLAALVRQTTAEATPPEPPPDEAEPVEEPVEPVTPEEPVNPSPVTEPASAETTTAVTVNG